MFIFRPLFLLAFLSIQFTSPITFTAAQYAAITYSNVMLGFALKYVDLCWQHNTHHCSFYWNMKMDPEKEEAIREVLRECNVHDSEIIPIKLMASENPAYNGFACALENPRSIGINSACLQLDNEVLKAIIAHEVGHLQKQHTGKLFAGLMHICATTSALYSILDNNFAETYSYAFRIGAGSLFTAVISAIIVPFYYKAMRYCEYKADAFSASIVGPDKMIQALKTLEKETEQPKDTSHTWLKKLKSIFNSHPTIEQRINYLNTLPKNIIYPEEDLCPFVSEVFID